MLGRFEAYGWHTQRVEDGNDVEAIDAAIDAAEADDRPSIIAVRTHIGYGSPEQAGHPEGARRAARPRRGAPHQGGLRLGPGQDVLRARRGARLFRRAIDEGERPGRRRGSRGSTAYAEAFPAEAAELKRRLAGRLARRLGRRAAGLRDGHRGRDPQREPGRDPGARRAACPELFGGSADLSESNLTDVKANGHDHFEADHAGRNLRFGVREHGMGAIANGIAYHGGFLPYCATFLTFSDYMRGAVRLASLSGLHVTYVWTHDSVGLGEDGPTHQPVEHYAALRAIPNLWFVRPGDANEAAAAWALAVERPAIAGAQPGPVALAFTRQKLPTLPGTTEHAREGVRRGGYVLREASGGSPRADPDRHGVGAPARASPPPRRSRPTGSRPAS